MITLLAAEERDGDGDSLNVLRAAAAFGVAQIFAVAQPDSTAEVRQVPEFPSVPAVIDLIDG